MCRIVLAIQPDNIDYGHLQQLVETANLIMHLRYVLDSLWHRAVCEKDKRIAFAGGIRLGSQERLYKLRRVWYETLVLSVDSINRKDGVFSDVGVPVF
jgi:hypothetical protein